MGRDGQPSLGVDHFADFPGLGEEHGGKPDPVTEEVALGGGDFDSRDDEEIVHRGAVGIGQSFFDEVGIGFTGIMVGDGQGVESEGPAGGDHVLGRTDRIAGKKGMGVEFQADKHEEIARGCGGACKEAFCHAKVVRMSVAFKEWALVCEALGAGRQSIILRKGGIAEGKAGFGFRYEQFYLMPTWFHEQLEKTILPPEHPLPEEREEEVEIRYAAVTEWTGVVRERERLAALRDFHILHDSVVEERFHYKEEPGLHVAFVRVFRLEPPVVLQRRKSFGGCRSWVEVPELQDAAMVSVLSDEEHERRWQLFKELLGA